MIARIKKWFKEIKDLKYFAYHDELTGLYNRHYLNTLDTSKYNFVYFLDINNLREWNKYGHTEGDKHIISFVKTVRTDYLSTLDCFIRYAGDEFIVLSSFPKSFSTNSLFSVGSSKIDGDFRKCLEVADKQMISNKNKLK
jgi:GGDEF domain-containing protein